MKRGFVVVALLIGLLAVMAAGSFAQAAPKSDAWIPGLASFIIPGLGQLLNDQMDKAIIHFGVAVAISVGGSLISSALFYNGFWYGYSVVAAAYLIWSAYSGIDAYNIAKEQGFSLGMTQDGLTLSYNF